MNVKSNGYCISPRTSLYQVVRQFSSAGVEPLLVLTTNDGVVEVNVASPFHVYLVHSALPRRIFQAWYFRECTTAHEVECACIEVWVEETV